MLFTSLVFGPIISRRFGHSLGINLLPADQKVCNFNCVYCECGFSEVKTKKIVYPSLEDVKQGLNEFLEQIKVKPVHVDAITFAGNGEPMLNPHFSEIVDYVVEFRNQHFPNVQLVLLSNGYLIKKKGMFEATLKFDKRVIKLDAGSNIKFQLIDQPFKDITLNEHTDLLCRYKGNLIVQTMFVGGTYNGISVDNTTSEEIENWLERLNKIRPEAVMLYSLDRVAPTNTLIQISKEKMLEIAALVEKLGIKTDVY